MSTVAYLVNQYPKVSHSFIRREILGLEEHGLKILRFSIRSCDAELVDEADNRELEKTMVILKQPLYYFLWSLFKLLFLRPVAFMTALKTAVSLGRKGDRGILYHLIYFIEACTFANRLSSEVGHIHAHFGTNSATVAMLASQLSSIPYSFTVHGPEEFDRVGGIGLTAKIEHAKFVVAISSFGRSQLYRWCGFQHWPKIKIVRCGVDKSYLSAPTYDLPTAPRIVCVGRLSEQKGHLMLIEAAGLLAKQNVSFELVLVGDGPLRAPIERRIQELNLTQNITITGWASSSEVKDYIIQSRVSVLPSFAEGLPVVIMESLALGRPVVSTYVAGIPELVEPGFCGWLVPPGSVEALAESIGAAVEASRETLETMGKTGKERVRRYHDASSEALKLKTLFEAREIPQSFTDSDTLVMRSVPSKISL